MSKIYSVYNIMQRKAIFSNLENIQMICSWKLFLNIQYQYKTHVYLPLVFILFHYILDLYSTCTLKFKHIGVNWWQIFSTPPTLIRFFTLFESMNTGYLIYSYIRHIYLSDLKVFSCINVKNDFNKFETYFSHYDGWFFSLSSHFKLGEH